MTAYQIQVQGDLDGATAFALPSTIPSPSDGGVIKIDAGAGVNVGVFDLNTLAGTESTPIWLRSIHVEFAALTRAARIDADISGSLARDQVIPILADAAAAPLMRPYVLTPGCILPVGAELDILTDDSDDSFSGSPVAGPHFIYLDVVPIIDDAQMTLIQDIIATAQTRAAADGDVFFSNQETAASGTVEIGMVSPQRPAADSSLLNTSVPASPGAQVQRLEIGLGDAAAAGESMQIQVQRVAAGTGTVTTLATVVLDDSIPANTRLSVTPDRTLNNLGLGDRIRVVRTYTAGGGPTPMTNTSVRVQTSPVAF